MAELIRRRTISGNEVTDAGTLVLTVRDNTAVIDVEGMPLTLVFEEAQAEVEMKIEITPDDNGVVVLMRRAPAYSNPYSFSARHFALADDGRRLTLACYVMENRGDHGVSRLVNYTITAEAHG